jgi:hypothetical protein
MNCICYPFNIPAAVFFEHFLIIYSFYSLLSSNKPSIKNNQLNAFHLLVALYCCICSIIAHVYLLFLINYIYIYIYTHSGGYSPIMRPITNLRMNYHHLRHKNGQFLLLPFAALFCHEFDRVILLFLLLRLIHNCFSIKEYIYDRILPWRAAASSRSS